MITYGKLSDIYDFQYGKGNTNPDNGGIYPIYGSNGVIGGYDKWNSEDAPVIGHIGANCGSVVWASGKHYVTYNGVICQIKNKANAKYGYYALLTSNLKSRVLGSAQPFISYHILNRVVIYLPPIEIQNKIAHILSTYDNLIENNNKRIKILEQMAENLYKEWFVRFRFPGHETTPIENGIPKGWTQYTICDLCLINKDSISAKDSQKEILYMDTSSITRNVIEHLESFKVIDAPGRARRIVKNNSIIFSTVRPALCHYGIMKNIPNNLVVSTGFAVFDTKYDIANILYLFLSSQSVVDYCQVIAEGAVATYPTITSDEIAKIKIYLPPIREAECWNEKFEGFFSEIQSLTQQNQNLIKQRDLLLPRLMSGKLAV